jgi:hypothetical protein
VRTDVDIRWLASTRRSDGGWCAWHHRGGRVEVKQKMVDLLASGAAQWKSDQATLH